MLKTLTRLMASLALLVGASPAALAAWELNMPRGVTELSREMYDLHMLIFWIVVVIAVGVFGMMIYSIFAFRRSKGAVAAQFSHSTKAEIIWTVIPIAILVAMAVPAAKALVKIEDTRAADLSIKVTGYQWKWHYEYLDDDVAFFSNLDRDSNRIRQVGSGLDPLDKDNYLRDVDNPLVVPVGKKVRILLTSNDVIHAWWVPELGGKKDAIPGYINEMWFRADETGTYRGQCAELCGRDHGFMPIVVNVVSDDEYAAFVAEQGKAPGQGAVAAGPTPVAPAAAAVAIAAKPVDSAPADAVPVAAAAPATLDMETLMANGETVHNTYCAACHQVTGQGLPPAFPSLIGSPVVTGPVSAHINQVLNGKPGTAMAAFGPQLSDADIAAVITYQRNSWGNETGDIVQPANVADAR